MGIPSYFSYIIQTHNNVLYKYATIVQQRIFFQRLYMDCNSILYDCYHNLSSNETVESMKKKLIEDTANKIENYIRQIQPTECVYIAFDGVAPMAKMEQQRTRRYKSWFEAAFSESIDPKNADPMKTTSMFTPGTEFMNDLSIYMRTRFYKKEKKLNVKQIIIATPDEPGEGEHKLYSHLRENPCKHGERCVVYGLDADLLMLSLLHLSYCPNLYVFREAPQFAKLLQKKNEPVQPDEPWFLDMAKLGRSISNEMRCRHSDNHRMYDYVFMCFLLGNDFLPHFPALNIRTNGITIILDVYRKVIANTPNRYLLSKTNPPKIVWKEFYTLMKELAKNEYHYICQEYSQRRKWDNKSPEIQPKKTVKEKSELLQNTPVLYRQEENYICPHESKWESRYYKILFPENTQVNDVCKNYLEGLEWVFQYYMEGKVDWIWKYNYHYPPLLVDLATKVPILPTKFLPQRMTSSVHPYTQLCYVLPPIHHHLLPKNIQSMLRKKYKHVYEIKVDEKNIPILDFKWAFCRFFWESHVNLPDIQIRDEDIRLSQ